MSAIKKLVLIFAIFSAFSVFAQEDIERYKIATDDTIQINVFDEPDLSIASVRIGANGTVSVPLIGQVEVVGLSLSGSGPEPMEIGAINEKPLTKEDYQKLRKN